MAIQDDFSRRTLLRIGALSILGAAVPNRSRFASAGESVSRGRRSCIFILLQGGPSHHDLWDPKPEASAEIRGPFESIVTSVTGHALGAPLGKTDKDADT